MEVKDMARRILIALGGNALKQAHEAGTTQEQFKNAYITARAIVDLMGTLEGEDDRVAMTHGNGPQAGNLLIQQEEATKLVPAQDFDVVGAMTQGQIGYTLQQAIQNTMLDLPPGDWRREMGEKGLVFGVVNQVLVDINDPDFLDPTKPVGNFFTKGEAEDLVKTKGYVLNPPPGKEYLEKKMMGFVIKQVKPESVERRFRRVVPSPDPIKNVEGAALKGMLDIGYLIIGSGGGGIPVVMDKGKLKGVFAVIDKDLAGERMGEAIGANEFYILTDIDRARLNFGKPNEKPIDHMDIDEAKKWLAEGHFLQGSMYTKVKACIRFLEWGGLKARIGHLEQAKEVIAGVKGTEVYK
ncbi:MAG: carbamate kinase [Candidatus Bathyarchaeia archaeon]